jgi:hypothetical protein
MKKMKVNNKVREGAQKRKRLGRKTQRKRRGKKFRKEEETKVVMGRVWSIILAAEGVEV